LSLIKRMRRQKALWWNRGPAADRFGKYPYDAPIEIECRWEDVAVEFVTAKDEKMVSKAVVYVDRPMKPGDRLKLGEEDSNTQDDPFRDTNAFEIKRFDKMPNLKNKETLLTAYL